jgi:hypothetical protein
MRAGSDIAWGKAIDRAKLGDADLDFHDLRGTAVTRLALSGCTTPQIAAITGHSPRDVDEILKAHYLGGQSELTEQRSLSWWPHSDRGARQVTESDDFAKIANLSCQASQPNSRKSAGIQ